MTDSSGPVFDPSRWRVLGMALLMFAVASLIVGFVLLTTCQAVSVAGVSSISVGCRYGFRSYGFVSLYIASLLTILSANLLALSLRTERPDSDWLQTRVVVSIFVGVGVTAVFGVGYLWPWLTR